jgi:hypothetical protein
MDLYYRSRIAETLLHYSLNISWVVRIVPFIIILHPKVLEHFQENILNRSPDKLLLGLRIEKKFTASTLAPSEQVVVCR